ncbi:MAG: YkgJ family cysteine cluster protein [Burkholderiaceae bacterium]|nr:YkgJ family cysteine cluster protein [Burkholderiaceae bacterium]
MTQVHCNGCTACCKHDRVFLGPKDDPKAYRWHVEGAYAVLDRKADGSCVYLTDAGCGIYGKAPDICQRMDCRELVQMTPPDRQAIRIQQNPQMALVYAAGRERSAPQDHPAHALRGAGLNAEGAGHVSSRPADGDGCAGAQSDFVQALHNASVPVTGELLNVGA